MKKAEAFEPTTFFPSLSRLRAFSEVARIGSISRASDELRRSQSSVTQAIQTLEEDLRADLLKRTNTGCFLTPLGEILQNRIEGCFSRLEAGVRDILKDSPLKGPSASSVVRRITKPQILALTALQEHGSFAQAAGHAKVSVTSLHRSARGLERQLGARLLKNTAQGIITTDAGSQLSNQMKLAIRELEWAQEEINARSGVLGGRLLIGAVVLAGTHFLAIGLDKFMKAYPEVAISVINSPYDVLLEKLRAGHIDFIINTIKNPPPANDVFEEPLESDSYVIAASRNHRLAKKRSISTADLRSSDWIAPRSRRGVFENLFKGGVSPRFNIETHSIAAIFILLTSGNRLAILRRSELALDKYLGNHLTALKYTIDEEPITMGVTVRKQWRPTPVQQAFLNFFRKEPME